MIMMFSVHFLAQRPDLVRGSKTMALPLSKHTKIRERKFHTLALRPIDLGDGLRKAGPMAFEGDRSGSGKPSKTGLNGMPKNMQMLYNQHDQLQNP
jgi:hypothetical protein